MQKQLEQIESELSKRIFSLFLIKYNGNKSEFARASQCRESTVRRVLKNEQGITINLLLRMALALDTTVNELLKGLEIKKEG